jgi:hypothetical protein
MSDHDKQEAFPSAPMEKCWSTRNCICLSKIRFEGEKSESESAI